MSDKVIIECDKVKREKPINSFEIRGLKSKHYVKYFDILNHHTYVPGK